MKTTINQSTDSIKQATLFAELLSDLTQQGQDESQSTLDFVAWMLGDTEALTSTNTTTNNIKEIN